MHLSSVCLPVLVGWTFSVHAQQFLKAKQSYDVMGLSDECTKVLNTELENCNSLLFIRTDRSTETIIEVLTREELDLICEPKCREELSALRQTIVKTCTSAGDVMRHSGFELPAFYFLDKFAYTYDINCHRHKTSGRFCDDVWNEWRAGKAKFDQCDDCYLGPLATQISSHIGVSDDSIALFKDVMAACPDAHYDVEVAQTSKIEIPTTVVQEDTRKCARWYTLKKGDTCVGISLSQKLSTVDLIRDNPIDMNCKSMPDEGTKLCLAESCDTHLIRTGETCATIAGDYGISKEQFLALNTMIDETCSNIDRWEGYVACVGPARLIAKRTKDHLQPLMKKGTSPITHRKPLAPGSSKTCTMFVNGRSLTDPDLAALRQRYPSTEGVDDRNMCNHVTDYNGVWMQEFWRLNPSLDHQKCVLKEEYSYCLAEEGGPRPEPQEGWSPRWGLRWG